MRSLTCFGMSCGHLLLRCRGFGVVGDAGGGAGAGAVARRGPPAAGQWVPQPLPRYGAVPGRDHLPSAAAGRVGEGSSTSRQVRSVLEARLVDHLSQEGQAAQLAAANLQLAMQNAEVSYIAGAG
jgi:hypothetical protein